MNKLVFLYVLLAAVGMLSAELAWPQPVTVLNYENVLYLGMSLQTSDGCHLLMWRQDDNGITLHKLCLYDQQYQPLWDAPLAVPGFSSEMVETSDLAFALVYSYSDIRVLKISRTGEFLWGPEGITALEDLEMDTRGALAADHNGGVYVSCFGRGDGYQSCLIQHLDASGTLTMPPTGVNMDDDLDSAHSDLIILPDDSVLISWSVLHTVKVQRVNYYGQFLWSQAISVASPTSYPLEFLCAFEGAASFALCVDHYNSVDVQRYNYSGAALWPQTVTAFSMYIAGYSLQPVLGSDNSIFVTGISGDVEFLQKISADGVAQYGDGINLNTGIGYLDGITQAIPDDAGGCVVVGCMYTNPRTVKAIQVSATGAVAVYEVSNTSGLKEHPSAHRYGNSIGIEWDEHESRHRGIKVQILDQQYQPQLAAVGMDLVYGSSGLIQEVQIAARANGSAVICQQTDMFASHWDHYLQIFTSDGQPVFGAGGLKINRPDSSLNGSGLVFCNGNLTMVVWGEQLGSVVSKRYQMFDAAGNILLPEGGLQIGTGSQSVDFVNVSTYLGDWYMIWSSSNTIWGQRISGTTPLWGNGIQITQPHPDIIDSMGNIKLDWPWLTWTLGSKPMLACLDANGAVMSGFPLWGMGMPVQNGTASICKQTFTVCGEYLHVLLEFYDVITPYYTYYSYTHTLINRQGGYLFDFSELQIEHNYNVFIHDGMVCIGGHYNNYVVREYDTSGNLAATHTIPVVEFQNNGWGVSGAKYLSNGDLLLLVTGYLNSSPTLRHIFITPQWQQVLPVDSVVLTGGSFPPSVSLLGDRAWIALTAESASMVFLQGVMLTGTPNPDPDPQAPAMPCLVSCSPNPFNPSTSISFSLPEAGPTTLRAFDLRGRRIATLLESNMPAGRHSIIWNGKDSAGSDAASGVYILRLEAGGKQHSRKVTLLK